ncbi:MAG: hypothetical protein QOI31_433 [Solirubrobacterales bacterium]|jgi:hypothetical protein|nr:hypothetical protein [Solirubrobacterales bacterium]
MTLRRIVSSSVAVVAATCVIASTAEAQDFSATFDTDNEGFSQVQYDPEAFEASIFGPAGWGGSGGNPGGFIHFDDPDSGPDEFLAYFVASAEVRPDQIGGTVSFDMRTSSGPIAGRDLFIAVQSTDEETSPHTIYCKKTGLTSSWATFPTVISPGVSCWKDGDDNTDATPADFEAALAGNPGSWFTTADFDDDAVNEETDLDNFIIEVTVLREITIKYKKTSRSFGGTLSQDEGPSGNACVQSVKVELYQEAGDEDNLIDTDVTDGNGKWKIARKAKKNKRYYAYAPATGADPVCAAEQSKTIKPVQ